MVEFLMGAYAAVTIAVFTFCLLTSESYEGRVCTGRVNWGCATFMAAVWPVLALVLALYFAKFLHTSLANIR